VKEIGRKLHTEVEVVKYLPTKGAKIKAKLREEYILTFCKKDK
jgi:hypothetical protein